MPRLALLSLLCAAAASAQVTKPATTWDDSPNYTNTTRETTYDIDAVVIHTTEGTYAGAISWFNSTASGVSAHYVISPTGTITQMVKDEDIAWHATYYNSRSIGIECAGYASSAATWTPALMSSLTQLVAWLCQEYDVPAVHLDDATDAYDYPDDKLAFSGVVAHSQVQPWNKGDPGAYFPWATFMADVNDLLAPPAPPPAPSGLAPAGYASVSSPATLSWSPMTGFGVDTYHVLVQRWSGSSWLYYAEGYPSSPTFSTTWTGEGYFRFAVWAHNGGGWGPGSAYAYFYGLLPPPVPPAPTGLSPTGSVTKSGASVKLSWGAVAGADTYEVYVQYYSGGTYKYYYAWTTSSASFTFWPTVKYTYYRWRVRAHNASGWGPWSGGASTSGSTGWAKFYYTK
jgi:N-acetyl-anhydromuramyl-L-alanine amidase AmpD